MTKKQTKRKHVLLDLAISFNFNTFAANNMLAQDMVWSASSQSRTGAGVVYVDGLHSCFSNVFKLKKFGFVSQASSCIGILEKAVNLTFYFVVFNIVFKFFVKFLYNMGDVNDNLIGLSSPKWTKCKYKRPIMNKELAKYFEDYLSDKLYMKNC